MKEPTTSEVPQIRFRGCDGIWEEKRLGAICAIGDADHWMPKTTSHGIPYVMTGDFCGINEIDFENAKSISEADFEKLSRKIKPELGDILFARYASVGAVRHIHTTRKFIASYSCAILKSNNSFNSEYLFFLLQSDKTQNQLKQSINTGSQGNIGIESLKQLVSLFPDKTEQTKIGEYFRDLDRLIGLHQRKHDKLVTLKKAMLQKMFPQPGAITPEIRFKGFSEAWKEKELGELVIFFKGKGLSKSEIDPSGTEPCIHYGQLFTEYSEVISTVISRAKGGNSYFRSIANDVLMPTSDVTPRGLAKASAINESDVIIGGDILVIRGDKKLLLGSFLSRFIRYMESQVLQMVSGSTVFHLYSSSMEKFRVKYPSVSEQQKIGTYFCTLDTLISKHTIQLQKLQQIKSACLEKMFV